MAIARGLLDSRFPHVSILRHGRASTIDAAETAGAAAFRPLKSPQQIQALSLGDFQHIGHFHVLN